MAGASEVSSSPPAEDAIGTPHPLVQREINGCHVMLGLTLDFNFNSD